MNVGQFSMFWDIRVLRVTNFNFVKKKPKFQIAVKKYETHFSFKKLVMKWLLSTCTVYSNPICCEIGIMHKQYPLFFFLWHFPLVPTKLTDDDSIGEEKEKISQETILQLLPKIKRNKKIMYMLRKLQI